MSTYRISRINRDYKIIKSSGQSLFATFFRSGRESLGTGVLSKTITLTNSVGTTAYIVNCQMQSIVTKLTPQFFLFHVEIVSATQFIVYFSEATEDADYILGWELKGVSA